jgi:hypothetical protein
MPAYVCVRDGAGKMITRLETLHVHGVDVDVDLRGADGGSERG